MTSRTYVRPLLLPLLPLLFFSVLIRVACPALSAALPRALLSPRAVTTAASASLTTFTPSATSTDVPILFTPYFILFYLILILFYFIL